MDFLQNNDAHKYTEQPAREPAQTYGYLASNHGGRSTYSIELLGSSALCLCNSRFLSFELFIFFREIGRLRPRPFFLKKKLYKLGETFKNIIHILLPVSAPLIEKYYRGHILNIGQYKHIIKRNLPFRDMLPISLKNEKKINARKFTIHISTFKQNT